MNIDEFVLVLASLSSVVALVYVPYRVVKNAKKKKSGQESWTTTALVIIALCFALAVANATSGTLFASLSALFWVIVIGPVIALFYYVYHITKLFSRSKNKKASLWYVAVVSALIFLPVAYAIADDYRDKRNERNYFDNVARNNCQIIDDTNKARCQPGPRTTGGDGMTLYERERLESSQGR